MIEHPFVENTTGKLQPLFIVAPHFPPASSPPAQRVRLLVKHAAGFGFYPTIFTVASRYREELEDPWISELLGQDFEKIEVKCLDQNKTRKFGIGDLGLRMLPFLFFALKKEIRKKKPAFVLYPVPPWYILIVAPVIKMITCVPYGIDFIDPWVHEKIKDQAGIKHRLAQWVARSLEGWVTKHAAVIFSVSEGINNNLLQRHPSLAGKPMHAIPYGAESGDFETVPATGGTTAGRAVVRYIGAIWDDCFPVLDGIMPALAQVHEYHPLKIEFYGTSYAAEGLASTKLDSWINQFEMQEYTSEQCLRVTYKQAVELTKTADLLFLIGGMQPYYAASKLMGLVVSGKPFVAFVHKDSFPAVFLKEIGYKYLVTYSREEDDMPVHQIEALKACFIHLLQNKDSFKPPDMNHPLIESNTAWGMTRKFMDAIASTL